MNVNELRWWKSSRSNSEGGQCVEVAVTESPISWWKSSRSNSGGGACVEVAVTDSPVTWWKSSRSNAGGGQCVEVAAAGTTWLVRDSKDPDGGMLAVSGSGWEAFVAAVRGGALR